MAETALRVGIASFAHVHAPAYASALREIPGANFVGIWDDHADRGAANAATHDTHFYARLDELLVAVDTWIAPSETPRHKELVLAAAAAGVHVLCEKPLATTIADARAMIDACAAAGVKLGTAFPVRYSDAVRGLRDAIHTGML